MNVLMQWCHGSVSNSTEQYLPREADGFYNGLNGLGSLMLSQESAIRLRPFYN
jgi:hypothetical protein